MTAGTFDPEAFMNQTTTEAGSTEYIPLDEGEYSAIAREPKFRQWTSKDGTQSGIALDILWEIDDAAQREKLGRDVVMAKQGLMLETVSVGDAMHIDWGKGKNVPLSLLREALGLNRKGEEFNPRMITGKAAKVFVKNRIDENGQLRSDVKAVAALV